MNFNKKQIEKRAETKLKYLLDSDSVAKEKRYKLGAWFHGEYRDKYKKATRHIESEDNLA